MENLKYTLIIIIAIIGFLILFKFTISKIIKNSLNEHICFFLKKILDPEDHKKEIPKSIVDATTIENLQEQLWDCFESLERSIKITDVNIKTEEIFIIQKIFWIALRMKEISNKK